MKTVLTTVNELKLRTSIGENIDVELLQPHLQIAQELYVSEVLGSALYDDIVNQYDNNTISGDTETLLNEYIIPSIAYSAWYCAYPFLAYKTQRTGINTTTTDVQTPVTVEEISIYGSRVENFKNFYLKRLEDYLIENSTLFPLFRKSETTQQGGGNIYLGYKTLSKHSAYWDKDYYGDEIIK
jgi:hypothetical protein